MKLTNSLHIVRVFYGNDGNNKAYEYAALLRSLDANVYVDEKGAATRVWAS